MDLLEVAIHQGESLPFYYDLGGDYGASLQLATEAPTVRVGFGELFPLPQIDAFCRRASEPYSPGARLFVIIDNMCALLVNDIPL